MALPAAARLVRALPPVRGRGRVALALHRRSTNQGSVSFRMRGGFVMTAPAGSAQTWRASFTGSYDDEEIELLLRYVTPGSVTLDIGASLGFYTVPLALAAQGRGAHVVAFEPVGANCAVLRRNLEQNGLAGRVSIVQLALGAQRAEVLLHVESGGAGNATIVTGLSGDEVARHDRAGGTGATELAQVVPLDEVPMPAEHRCSAIKMDAEGFEMDVLTGATAFVAEHRPAILGEFSPAWLETRGVDSMAPVSWAGENGYVCSELVYARRHPLSEQRRLALRRLQPLDRRSGTSLLLEPGESAGIRS